MAQISKLPTELQDAIFAHVQDAPDIFPFLLCRATHASASLALYRRVTLSFSKIEVLKKCLRTEENKVRFTGNLVKSLRINFEQPPEPSSSENEGQNVAPAVEDRAARLRAQRQTSLEHSAAINALVDLTPTLTRVELFEPPNICIQNITHKTLKWVAIYQQPLAGPRTQQERQEAIIDFCGPTNVETVAVISRTVELRGHVPIDTLKHLLLVGDSILVVDQIIYPLWKSHGPQLPFTRLELVCLSTRWQKTVPWFAALAYQLIATRNSLRVLLIDGIHHQIAEDHRAVPIDLKAYTALKHIGLSAKPNAGDVPGVHRYDGNRLRLVSPTVQSLAFILRDTTQSYTAIVAGIDDFLQDNASCARLSALRKIEVRVERWLIDHLRKEDEAAVLSKEEVNARRRHRKVKYSDGRTVFKPMTDYGRTVAALRGLLTEGISALEVLEAQYQVNICLADVRKVVTKEDQRDLERETMSV